MIPHPGIPQNVIDLVILTAAVILAWLIGRAMLRREVATSIRADIHHDGAVTITHMRGDTETSTGLLEPDEAYRFATRLLAELDEVEG